MAASGHVPTRGRTLHPEKTRAVDARREAFTFLGQTHRWQGGSVASRRQQEGVAAHPRRTAAEDAADGLESSRQWSLTPTRISGARDTTFGACADGRRAAILNHFVEMRFARSRAPKHGRRRPAWSLVSGGVLWRHHGLERWDLPVRLRPAGRKASAVNVEGSRMRESRTYGSTRGCWPVRLARQAGI